MKGGKDFKNLMNMTFGALEQERALDMHLNNLTPMCPDYNSKNAVLEARKHTRNHVRMMEHMIKDVTGVHAPPNGMGQVPSFNNFEDGLQMALMMLQSLLAEFLNIINLAGIETIRQLFLLIREDAIVDVERFNMLLDTLGQPTNGGAIPPMDDLPPLG